MSFWAYLEGDILSVALFRFLGVLVMIVFGQEIQDSFFLVG